MGEQAVRKQTMDSDILRLDASTWCVSGFDRWLVKAGRASFVIDSMSRDGYNLYCAWKGCCS